MVNFYVSTTMLELRRFCPSETVDMVFKSVQPDLFALAAKRRPDITRPGGAANLEDGEDNEELVTFT
ncbi:hypothetical protein SPSYN_01075 [Sporotomaculum syntrophicum]|uniref:Uncharacterized protein n=1 Tax=Sporotomaculum syntrophicum TaxID=182264 RepID=A0A9D2WPA3_9FIRM|nr:hypothetical protein [Sporotomaculum syntrophicum]KAF1084939.1 hypothetical protein SPSYN_01075 [Sporotomaculum syntrophicum]